MSGSFPGEVIWSAVGQNRTSWPCPL